MESDRDLSAWLDNLKTKLSGLREGAQRRAVFISRYAALSPEEAAVVFQLVVRDAVVNRDAASKLALEALMLTIATETWPEDHLRATRESAEENDDRLTGALLDVAGAGAVRGEEATFKVPNYGHDRPLTLGERRALATRPERRLVALAIRDPHPMVISKLLDNPKLTEQDVVGMAARRPAPEPVLRELGAHPKWRLRRHVALALCLNPYTPPRVSLSLVPGLPVDDIIAVASDDSLFSGLRIAAMALLALTE